MSVSILMNPAIVSGTEQDYLRTHWQHIPTGKGIDELARVDAKSMHKHSYDHYLEKVAALGLRGERMLDAGCGTGTSGAFPSGSSSSE
jgi:hypothetical protein